MIGIVPDVEVSSGFGSILMCMINASFASELLIFISGCEIT